MSPSATPPVALVSYRPMATFGLRILKTYVCRVETLISILLVWLLWLYVRWLTDRYKPMMGGKRIQTKIDANDRHRIIRMRFGMIQRDAQEVWQVSKWNLSFYASQGPRPYMEDRMCFMSDLNTNISIYGLFDGHGGQVVSEFLERSFVNSMAERIKSSPLSMHTDWNTLAREEVLKLDEQLLKKHGARKTYITGSTLVAAVVHQSRFLTVINVGDSRAILCDMKGNAQQISVDHKPNSTVEKARIESSGGFIQFNGVWRVGGILATSRAMGDTYLKRLGYLTAIPDVFTIDLLNKPVQFIILASDGLWDVLSNQEAVDAVLRAESDSEAAKYLVQTALMRNSMDNVSVMVVRLPKL